MKIKNFISTTTHDDNMKKERQGKKNENRWVKGRETAPP